MSKKNKPRWKDLPYYEMFARRFKRDGGSEEMCELIREHGRRKEKNEAAITQRNI